VDDSRPRVIESYRDYTPPFDVARTVRTLLQTVPPKYLRGLDCVVLNNFESLSRRSRLGKTWSRKSKVRMSEVRGLYHPKWQGNLPWIEIHVDKTLSNFPSKLLWITPARAFCLGDVLFHELGHHVHYMIRPEHKEKEDVAENWNKKLMVNFLRKKYWYTVWPLLLVGKVRKWRSQRNAGS
jgi:hypothetical protein